MPDFDDDARLTAAFGAFRDEVAPYVSAPGSAAAHRTVRHRRRTGAAAIAASAVLLVGGPAVGLAAAHHDTPTPPPVIVTNTPTPVPTVTTEPPRIPAEPEPTATSSPPTEEALPEVPGKVFYTDQAGKIYVNGRQYPGGVSFNVNVSPDGRRVTWVEDDNLVMSDLDGGHKRTVHLGVESMCAEPVWSGDSTRLLAATVTPGQTSMAVLYLAGGAGDDLGERAGCHYRWSADGKRIAYAHGDLGGLTVRDLYGGHQVTLEPSDVGGRFFAELNGISADGGRVCAFLSDPDEPGGDAARGLFCNTIIDVATRKPLDLGFEGDLRNVVFLADGGMLARIRTEQGSELLRLGADDNVIARTVESTTNAGRGLLAYTP